MSSIFALIVLACFFVGFNLIDWVVKKINLSTKQSIIAVVTMFAYEVVGIFGLWKEFNEYDNRGKRLLSPYECAFKIQTIILRWCMELVAIDTLRRSSLNFKVEESSYYSTT